MSNCDTISEEIIINNIIDQIEYPSSYDVISDKHTINCIMDINYSCNLKTPGIQLSYKYLWDGYDTSNNFGPSLTEDERLYTYLTEYKEFDN